MKMAIQACDERLDLLASLRMTAARRGDVFRLRSGVLWVGDPVIGKQVLANRAGDFTETSDFFHTGNRTIGPREAQIAIGRRARQLLRAHLLSGRAKLPRLLADRLLGETHWPDAGNLLLADYLRPVLLTTAASAESAAVLDAVINRAVLAGTRDRWSRLRRRQLRRRAFAVLAAEIGRRRTAGAVAAADLLDAVLAGAAADCSVPDLIEIYLAFVFATVGSIGFALGWSIYLVGSNPESRSLPPAWIVREALRLYPVAWLFGRRPARDIQLAGHRVGPRDTVHVCSYLAHRSPGHWADPDEFRPQRWADPDSDGYLPFGYGQHSCAGAAESMTLLEELVGLVLRHRVLSVRSHGRGPFVNSALAPPPFTLTLGEPF